MDNPEKWEPLTACPYSPPLSVSFTIHLENIMQHVRVLSIGTVADRPPPNIAALVRHLDPKIVVEISIDEAVDNETFHQSLRAQVWPCLRKLRLNLAFANVSRLLEAIAHSCAALQEVYLYATSGFYRAYYFDATSDTDEERLRMLKIMIQANKRTLTTLGIFSGMVAAIPDFEECRGNLSRWNSLPDMVFNALDFPFNKIQFDGLSLWGAAIRKHCVSYAAHKWERKLEAFFTICHPQRTLESLCDLACAVALPFKFGDAALQWFLAQLQPWVAHFESKSPIERITMEGWGWFRNCLGYIFHWEAAGAADRIRPLLAVCPSVMDAITIRNSSRRPWSSKAVLSVLSDTEWWRKSGHDFNLSENWAVHPIHYLVRDGKAVLCAIQSPLLTWDVRPDVQHFFVSMLQFRMRCESGAEEYDKALTIAYHHLNSLELRPVREPLTDLQSTALSRIAPLNQALPMLTSNWKVLMVSTSAFLPSEFCSALKRILGAEKLPENIAECAAIAFWRPITSGRAIPQLSLHATHDALMPYLRQIVAAFPVVPFLAQAFVRAPPTFSSRAAHMAVKQLFKEYNINAETSQTSIFI
jgi:hypothetical protein